MPYNLYKPENKHILYFDERQLKIYNYKKKKMTKASIIQIQWQAEQKITTGNKPRHSEHMEKKKLTCICIQDIVSSGSN